MRSSFRTLRGLRTCRNSQAISNIGSTIRRILSNAACLPWPDYITEVGVIAINDTGEQLNQSWANASSSWSGIMFRRACLKEKKPNENAAEGIDSC